MQSRAKSWLGRFVAMAVLGLALVAPATGAAKGGNGLDPSFGNRGRAVVPFPIGESRFWYAIHTSAARTPTGATVVIGARPGINGGVQIVRFLPNGQLDPGFGQGGMLLLSSLRGTTSFALVDVAVDAENRIVLAGYSPAIGIPGIVVRLQPDGTPDPTFGGGDGVATPSLPIPTLNEASGAPPARSPVWFQTVAIDRSDRIVLAGWAHRATFSCNVESGVLARLNPDGSVDPSFGKDGAVVYDSDAIEAIANLALGPDNQITVSGKRRVCKEESNGDPRIDRLSAAGQLDPTFGGAGFARLGTLPLDLVVDGRGRTVFLGSDGKVHRLLPGGRPDGHFGISGTVRLPVEGTRSGFYDIALNPKGGVFATGVEVQRPRAANPERRLLLAAVTANGRLRANFGERGVRSLRSGKRVRTVGREVMVDAQGRALVAGSVFDPRLPYEQGLALFRFAP